MVLEIETEKAVQEVGAPVDGVLHHVLAEGAQLQVETLIGYVLAPGEAPPVDGNGAAPPSVVKAAATPHETRESVPAGEVRASPIARRIAREHGVDLTKVEGTGPGGRIVESDVRAAADARSRPATTSVIPAGRRVPLSVMRRGIGERLRRTVDTAVSLTLTREVRVEALVAARRTLGSATGQSVSYDAFIVKALAAALRAVSRLERDDRRHGSRRVLGDQHWCRGRGGGRSCRAGRPQCRRAERDEDRRGDSRPERQSVSRCCSPRVIPPAGRLPSRTWAGTASMRLRRC